MTALKRASAADAIRAAVRYAQLAESEITSSSALYADGLYEVCFTTDWQKYDCYVDAFTLDVPGFSFEPLGEQLGNAERAA